MEPKSLVVGFISILICISICVSDETYGQNLFCLHRVESNDKTELTTKSSETLSNVDGCLRFCLSKYFRFAGLQSSISCICFSSFMKQISEECNEPCVSNSSQLCGGKNSVSVYSTGRLVPGPLKTFEEKNTSETNIFFEWSPPLAINSDQILGYSLKAVASSTFSNISFPPNQEWNYPSATLKAELPNLQPGTAYNVSITAKNEYGFGEIKWLISWTKIGDPPEPEVPEVIRRDNHQLTVKLTPVQNDNGPISSYLVIVSLATGGFFEPSKLKSWQEAQDEDLQYYITAELKNEDLKKERAFIVGDGKMYGKYLNQPLETNAEVKITLGVVSSLHDTTKKTFSSNRNQITVFKIGSTNDDTDPIAIALSIGIVICCTLLLLTLAGFYYLHLYYSKRQRRHRFNNQEIPLRGPILEVDNQAYIHDGFLFEGEEEERVNHYQKLKDQIWNIPYNFLDVKNEFYGRGSFGNIAKGTVQMKGFSVPVAIYVIADSRLSKSAKKTMLSDLDLLIRPGCAKKLDHLIALIGLCETSNSIYVVLEHHPASLKDILLESRSLTHNNELSHFCSLNSAFIFQVMIGIAKGMQYLEEKKIVHSRLACRSILMEDGLTPKVSSFGLAHFSQINEEPDYSRWTAQEVFRNNHFSVRSDVWSFGCVLWEITALGGTPYCQVESHDIMSHVMRGARLHQLPYVGDELYQWMLLCWQLDLDERPSFQMSILSLETMAVDSNNLVNFTVYPGLQYEPYIVSKEIKHFSFK